MNSVPIRRIAFAPVVGLMLFFTGCDTAPPPTSPQTPESLDLQASHVPGQPVCHDVHGEIHEEGIPEDFGGEMSGDLVGTTAGTVNNLIVNGKAGRNFGTRTYSITGGEVPALIGSEFTVEFVGITLGELPFLRVTERASVAEGVSKANLTAVGMFDARDFPHFTLDLEYEGVVCP